MQIFQERKNVLEMLDDEHFIKRLHFLPFTVHPESIHSASLFHILLCYSLIPKLIKFIIFLKILQIIPHNDNVKAVAARQERHSFPKILR